MSKAIVVILPQNYNLTSILGLLSGLPHSLIDLSNEELHFQKSDGTGSFYVSFAP